MPHGLARVTFQTLPQTTFGRACFLFAVRLTTRDFRALASMRLPTFVFLASLPGLGLLDRAALLLSALPAAPLLFLAVFTFADRPLTPSTFPTLRQTWARTPRGPHGRFTPPAGTCPEVTRR